MLLKWAIRKRILQLCDKGNIISNRHDELSAITPITFKDTINNRVNNPSTVVIYKISNTLNMNLKDFFNTNLSLSEFDD